MLIGLCNAHADKVRVLVRCALIYDIRYNRRQINDAMSFVLACLPKKNNERKNEKKANVQLKKLDKERDDLKEAG